MGRATSERSARRESDAPAISPALVRLFTNYSRRYVRRHFHRIRLLKSHALTNAFSELPVIVFFNHAAWWDPLICLLLAANHFPEQASFGPIDASALKRYKFLAKLGFFGIEQGETRGAAEFLRKSRAILQSPRRMLWIPPQGRFTDARARPMAFQRGLAHVATRVAPAVFLPLAIEYTFWEERLPEILLAWGTPLFTDEHAQSRGVDGWTSAFELTMQDTQDALAAAAQRRSAEEWETLARGRVGTTALYDLTRWARARISGEAFSAEHSRV